MDLIYAGISQPRRKKWNALRSCVSSSHEEFTWICDPGRRMPVSLFRRKDVRRSQVNSRLIRLQLGEPWCLHLVFGIRWWWISLKLPARSSAASGYRATPCAQTRLLCKDRNTNTKDFTWILWINGWWTAIFMGESLTDTLTLKHFGSFNATRSIWNCVFMWTAGLHGPNLRWVRKSRNIYLKKNAKNYLDPISEFV